MTTSRTARFLFAAVLACASAASSRAHADGPPAPLVHPIYAQVPDAPDRDVTRRTFNTAAEHYRLGQVEVIDIPAPAAPRAGALSKSGAARALKLEFAEAQKDLDAAAAEVADSGGDGLSTTELFDLYLYRGMVLARADWNAPAAPTQDETRTRAFQEYLRAATITTDRPLNPRLLPPQVLADFARAVTSVRARPRGTLVVRGSADAQVSLDGAAPVQVGGGVTFRDVVYGSHLVNVDEVGRMPWGTTVTLDGASLNVDVPEPPALVLEDATAASHAKRMGAIFALVAQPKPGPGARLELRLVDITGLLHDSVVVAAVGEAGQVDAGVMRLDEEARRIQGMGLAPGSTPIAEAVPPSVAGAPAVSPPILLAPPPAKAHFKDDPLAWARDHWPLLTAAGVLVASVVILSIVVAADR